MLLVKTGLLGKCHFAVFKKIDNKISPNGGVVFICLMLLPVSLCGHSYRIIIADDLILQNVDVLRSNSYCVQWDNVPRKMDLQLQS